MTDHGLDAEQFLKELSPQEEEAFVEAMFLVANADGYVSEVELQEIYRSIEAVTRGRVVASKAQLLMQRAREASQAEGREQRLQALTEQLGERRRHHALVLAAQVGAVDAGISPEEQAILMDLAKVFGIRPDMVEAVVAAVT